MFKPSQLLLKSLLLCCLWITAESQEGIRFSSFAVKPTDTFGVVESLIDDKILSFSAKLNDEESTVRLSLSEIKSWQIVVDDKSRQMTIETDGLVLNEKEVDFLGAAGRLIYESMTGEQSDLPHNHSLVQMLAYFAVAPTNYPIASFETEF